MEMAVQGCILIYSLGFPLLLFSHHGTLHIASGRMSPQLIAYVSLADFSQSQSKYETYNILCGLTPTVAEIIFRSSARPDSTPLNLRKS